ncbi:Nuclear transcription factor Y subunit gamma [Lonchura striata]|uniref:Nuclear transcription factor Y subunit gamma n=1 Tax=Lonchura striata TaxID=40157 RepID=A0A218UYA9_9PASE|nr:Nuclear transcription factor Y subunit gamma [Lonchura striata domestica]
MKLDEDVKVHSGFLPGIYDPGKGFKRNDIAMAITKFDQFDFLIDIVPRDELKPPKRQTTPVTMQVGEGQQVQIVQAQPQGQSQQGQSSTGQTMQVMQQIITNTGEIQQIPVQLNAGQLQYIRLAQPVSGTQVVQGQIQTLATNAQQITQTEVQQGQQQFSQFTDGQQLYQIQQVTMPAGQDITQPMFIQSSSQSSDTQATQVTGD